MKSFFPITPPIRLLGALVLGMLAGGLPYPVLAGVEPVLSYAVIDHYSGQVLAQKNSTERLQVASLTKIATACVVIDWAEATNTSLDNTMKVPGSVATLAGANPVGMQPGDEISIRSALYCALMASDNVAAETLGHHVGLDLLNRRGEPGYPIEAFVREMNALASKLKMENTRFVNAHGLDFHLKKRQRPYSTSLDIAVLCQYAMDKAAFRFYVSQPSRKIQFKRHGETKNFLLKNTNELVEENGVDGVKTGQTSASGPCLALSGTRPDRVTKLPDGSAQIQKQRLIVVVLGAQDRFGGARELLDFGWHQYDQRNPVTPRRVP